MRKRMILCSIPLFVLAACHGKVDISDSDGNESEGNVHIAMGDATGGNSSVSINAPGFKADVSLPSINIGGNVDLDGITLAPNTQVSGLNVDAQGGGGTGNGSGTVRLRFTNPQTPEAVLDHYVHSAADAGYGAIARTGTSLMAKKGDKSFSLEIAPEGNGSRGTITVSGKDKD